MTTAQDFDELDLTGLEIEEEKPKRTTNTTGTGVRRGRKPRVSALVDQLLVPIATLSKILGMAVPMTAHVMQGQAHPMVTAAVALAAPHPKMMAALEKVAKVGPASDLATGLALIGLTLAVEIGRVPHTNPLARSLGITELYDQFYQPAEGPTIPSQGQPPSYEGFSRAS